MSLDREKLKKKISLLTSVVETPHPYDGLLIEMCIAGGNVASFINEWIDDVMCDQFSDGFNDDDACHAFYCDMPDKDVISYLEFLGIDLTEDARKRLNG